MEASDQCHPQPHYLLDRSPVLLNRRLGGSRAGLDILEKGKSLPLPGFKPQIIQPVD